MKTIVLLSFFCAAAQAQPPAGAVSVSTAAAVAVSTMPAVVLTWDHTPKEVYADGGKTFIYEGRTYALKLGYKRGEYVPFVKNYKSIPVFMLTDITDGPDNFRIWNAGLLESDEPFSITNGSTTLSVKLEKKDAVVYRHFKKNEPGKKVASLPYEELRAAWAGNAARYMSDFKGKPAYFVPQAFYNQSGCHSVGYVVSAPDPYFTDTGLPLDFVELYRYTKASTDRRRLAYSIPMGASFTRSMANGKKWAVNELRETELQDALAEELDTPDECNKELREPMQKAAAEK